MSSQINRSFFGAFALGFVAATALRLWDKKKANDEDRQNSGARPEGDDCSLFWGDKKELTTILDHRKFLDKEFYGKMVRDCIICCVDCLIVRYNSHLQREEVLLVERGTHPAKGIWWLPGGRLFKGETFFDGAKRKARDETGLSEVTPIQVLGFYNTFFPTSEWDTEDEKGTQTVQPIVYVKVKSGSEILLDRTSERYRWIPLQSEVARENGEDKYIIDALCKLEAWRSTYGEMA